jgi:hypothetical protein
MLALKRSYGPLLNIKLRAFAVQDRAEDSGHGFISLNAFGIESVEQVVLAAKSWIDESLSTNMETIL